MSNVRPLVMSPHFCFFFNDTATTEIYTLSLHDALPIFPADGDQRLPRTTLLVSVRPTGDCGEDRKSTRLHSSHAWISYAVLCLKKKTITVPIAVVLKLEQNILDTHPHNDPA